MAPRSVVLTRVLLVTAVVVLAAALVWILADRPAQPDGSPALAAPPPGGDFTLIGESGPVALGDLRGQVAVLYFGYSQCPDVCPVDLAWLGLALRELSPDELVQVTGVFVSIDPERDTPERLAEYARYFHPRIIGLTGSDTELADIATRYGAAYRRSDSESAMGYMMDHSASYHLVDRAGRLREILPGGSSAEELSAAIRVLLSET